MTSSYSINTLNQTAFDDGCTNSTKSTNSERGVTDSVTDKTTQLSDLGPIKIVPVDGAKNIGLLYKLS